MPMQPHPIASPLSRPGPRVRHHSWPNPPCPRASSAPASTPTDTIHTHSMPRVHYWSSVTAPMPTPPTAAAEWPLPSVSHANRASPTCQACLNKALRRLPNRHVPRLPHGLGCHSLTCASCWIPATAVPGHWVLLRCRNLPAWTRLSDKLRLMTRPPRQPPTSPIPRLPGLPCRAPALVTVAVSMPPAHANGLLNDRAHFDRPWAAPI
jgi:hypothetical protein